VLLQICIQRNHPSLHHGVKQLKVLKSYLAPFTKLLHVLANYSTTVISYNGTDIGWAASSVSCSESAVVRSESVVVCFESVVVSKESVLSLSFELEGFCETFLDRLRGRRCFALITSGKWSSSRMQYELKGGPLMAEANSQGGSASSRGLLPSFTVPSWDASGLSKLRDLSDIVALMAPTEVAVAADEAVHEAGELIALPSFSVPRGAHKGAASGCRHMSPDSGTL